MDNSAPPQTENRFATIVNRILKSVIEGAGEAEIEALIFALAPEFFAIPFIGWLAQTVIKFFVGKYGHIFYEIAAKTAAKIIVDIQADQESSKTKEKAGKLQDAIEKGDQSAIDKADQDLEDAWGNLIHMDGSAPP